MHVCHGAKSLINWSNKSENTKVSQDIDVHCAQFNSFVRQHSPVPDTADLIVPRQSYPEAAVLIWPRAAGFKSRFVAGLVSRGAG